MIRQITIQGHVGLLGSHMKGILLTLILAILLTSCAHEVSVRQVNLDRRYEQMDQNAVRSMTLSQETMRFLRQKGLTARWKVDPLALLMELDRDLSRRPDRTALSALGELCYLEAKRRGAKSEHGTRLYWSCAVYAYRYLFDAGFGPAPGPYHPNSRLACEVYNRSLAALLIHFRHQKLRLKEGMHIPLLRGHLKVERKWTDFMWRPEELDAFYAAYEFEVEGLDIHQTRFGLGVPLIVLRTPPTIEKRRKEERFLPKVQQTYAATLFVRIHLPPARGSGDTLSFNTEFELHDPMTTDHVPVANRMVPLETDLTTPLAYMIHKNEPSSGITGMIDVGAWEKKQGLHMLQPLRKGKIPVVLVHGLMSSPVTWIPMFNSLIGDPELRKYYQFWFFQYPTGNPILYSSALLRQALLEVQKLVDPKGDDPAFNKMVVVGHSMGGLLTKFMVQESGDRLWKLISDKSFSEVNLSTESRAFLERALFFESLAFITRVIFISSPHRGSEMADLGIARLAASLLIEIPVGLVRRPRLLFKRIATKRFRRALGKKIGFDLDEDTFTSISGLSTHNPILKMSADQIPISSKVTYHTIMGNQEAADTFGGSDGVVPNWSSRLNGAASEKIVESGHSAHEHPLAILEVRRILLEHIKEIKAKQTSR